MRAKTVIILFLLALALSAVFGGRVVLFAYQPARPGAQESAIIEIHKGESASVITRALVQQNIVTDAETFMLVGRITRHWNRIKTGEYQVSAALSPMQLFGVLSSGISVKHPITVREGENMFEVAADIESKKLASKGEFLRLCRDPKLLAALKLEGETLEGYLYPETYYFNKAMSPEEMIRTMVKRFHQSWGLKENERARALGLTRAQAVTLASMIEKETGAKKERPLISSVFHNRLRKKMRLQSDPTTIYGIWDRYHGNLHREDLLTPTPYNTYTVSALPAGPIGNPGHEALQAALYPDQSEFLFFVSHNDGTHEFTRSLAEHVSAVRKFQLDPKAREGKSWRNLSKDN